MSKHIERIPLADIQWLRIYHNTRGRTLTQAMAETGADWGWNGGLYDMSTGKLCGHVKADGVVLSTETWGCWGLAWNEGPDVRMVALPAPEWRNYISGTELLTPGVGLGDKLTYPSALGRRRGRRAEGITGKELVVWASSDGTDGLTLEALQEEMYRQGCEAAIGDDGGQSVKARSRDGRVAIEDPGRETTATYLLVKLKDAAGGEPPEKEDEPMSNYKVPATVGLNIRKEPVKSSAKVGGYSYGAVVAVLEVKDGWARTDRGWVYLAYLEPVADRVTDNGIVIVQDIIPQGRKNRPGRANPCAYITIHETGNKARTADAKAHGTYLKGASAETERVSWHYTVDDHSVVQHLPDGESAYHATDGPSGPGNSTSIGIEICVNEGGDFERAKANAAALVRLLRAEHGIGLDHVVQHHHWYNKDCPQTIRNTPGAWEAFLDLCDGKETPSDTWAQEATEAVTWAAGLGIYKGDGSADGGLDRPVTKREELVLLHRAFKAIKAGQ